jgi:hypothetical protein
MPLSKSVEGGQKTQTKAKKEKNGRKKDLEIEL